MDRQPPARLIRSHHFLIFTNISAVSVCLVKLASLQNNSHCSVVRWNCGAEMILSELSHIHQKYFQAANTSNTSQRNYQHCRHVATCVQKYFYAFLISQKLQVLTVIASANVYDDCLRNLLKSPPFPVLIMIIFHGLHDKCG